MKKVLSILLAAALMLTIGAVGVLAAADTRGAGFTDADDDGVCDLRSGADSDGDGVCDRCPGSGACPRDGDGRRAGGGAGQGAAFSDADGDGVCDRCPGVGACPRDGDGAQRGRTGGRSN